MTAPAAFLSPLTLRRSGDPDSGQWVVVGEFRYHSAILGADVAVPDGFATDLASVPRLPLMYLLCGDTADEPAVIHDYLYTTRAVPRKQADAVFAEAIGVTHAIHARTQAAAGVPASRRALTAAADSMRRGLMWAGVRVGGGAHYAPAPPAA